MTNILITGASGMIGREIVEILEREKYTITKADVKTGQDLTDHRVCQELCHAQDIIYHLAGIKGNPRAIEERPCDFLFPMVQMDMNMVKAAREEGATRFIYTSSIAVLNPQTDTYAAWAKASGERFIEASRIQYPHVTSWSIVRPCNVYGRYDNFDNPNAMVITSLIKKALQGKTFDVWGDGTEERDFINSRDVARGLLKTMETMPQEAINLCSGEIYTIGEVCHYISKYTGSKPVFLRSQKIGDKKRIMTGNGYLIGFKPSVSFEEGINEIVSYRRRMNHEK